MILNLISVSELTMLLTIVQQKSHEGRLKMGIREGVIRSCYLQHTATCKPPDECLTKSIHSIVYTTVSKQDSYYGWRGNQDMIHQCPCRYPSPIVYQVITCIRDSHSVGFRIPGVSFIHQDSVINQRVHTCTVRGTGNTPGYLQK